MKNRRYDYLKGTQFKSFTSYKKMKEFAKDENNNGVYYISCPDITFKYSREQILSL